MLYVGVDAHKRSSRLTVMDDRGQVLKRQEIPSTRVGVQAALGRYRRPLKAVLEASYSWGSMYDWLGEVASEVVLAHPLKVRAIAEARIKTDAIDSETLAHLLRADLIPPAHAPSKETRAVKRVLRQRLFLVRVRGMLKNRVHALLAQHQVERPSLSDLFGVKGMRWLRGLSLPMPDGALLVEQVDLLEAVREKIRSTDQLISDLARGDRTVGYLETVPGIGDFFSVLVRYEVDEMGRFRSAKKFASYTGLVPSTYASGDRMVHGRITKQGNKWLRWALVEAVTPAIGHSPWLRRYYQRIKVRRGAKDARTATARKLAEIIWTVWTEQRPYEERV